MDVAWLINSLHFTAHAHFGVYLMLIRRVITTTHLFYALVLLYVHVLCILVIAYCQMLPWSSLSHSFNNNNY